MEIRMLTVAVAFLLLIGFAGSGAAEVNVNVGVYAPPPAYVIPAPPDVIVIPGSYVYFVPGINVDIFFYHGYWWRPYHERWYRSRGYNGPWGYVARERVPRAVVGVPPHFRDVPPGHERIPHGQLKKNWSRWEREKHWDKAEGRHGNGERGEGRERHEGGEGGGHGRGRD